MTRLDRAGAEALARAGIDALRRGDARTARKHLEQVIASGVIAPPWFLLAQACRHLGDEAGEATALDALLAANPRNVGALLLKGDASARTRDRRAASSYYRMALAAASAADSLPASIATELSRAEAYLAETSNDYQAHLHDRLADAGFAEDRLEPRMREALSILTGEKQVYLQQPSAFFYPRLPHIQFYERSSFAWAERLETAASTIEAELRAFLSEGDDGFRPYVEADPNRPRKAHSLFGDPKWSALHLSKNGIPTEYAARFPATLAALDAVPLPRITGRSPMVLFSLLRPGTHIEPHSGLFNTRLICHLPLIIPPRCALRVGNETRAWERGKLLIFDDSIEHEAWNNSGETRIILLFEIWRPELTANERESLTAMFEAIDSYQAN